LTKKGGRIKFSKKKFRLLPKRKKGKEFDIGGKGTAPDDKAEKKKVMASREGGKGGGSNKGKEINLSMSTIKKGARGKKQRAVKKGRGGGRTAPGFGNKGAPKMGEKKKGRGKRPSYLRRWEGLLSMGNL